MESQSDCVYWPYGGDNNYSNSINSPIMKIEQDRYRGADSINPIHTIDLDCGLSYDEDPSGLGHHHHHHRHHLLDYNGNGSTYPEPENYTIHHFKTDNNSSNFLGDCEFLDKDPDFETEGILVNVNHEPISREVNPFRYSVKLEKTDNEPYSPPEAMDFPTFDVDVPGGIDGAIPIDLDLDELFKGWGEALNHIFWKVANPVPFHDITGPPKVDDDIIRKLRYSLYGPSPEFRNSPLRLPPAPPLVPTNGTFNYYHDASSLLNELLGDMNPPIDSSYYQPSSPLDGSGSGVTSLSDQSTTTASTLVSSDRNSPTHYHEQEASRIKLWERKCSVCGIIIFGGEQRYDAHVKNAHELTCLCGETFKFKLKLNNHIKNSLIRGGATNHGFTPGDKIKPLFECDFCDEIFHNRNKAFKHREEHLTILNSHQVPHIHPTTKAKPRSRKNESQLQTGHASQLSRPFVGGTGKPPLMGRILPAPGERKRRSSKTPTPSGETSPNTTDLTERSKKYRKKTSSSPEYLPPNSKDIRKPQVIQRRRISSFTTSNPSSTNGILSSANAAPGALFPDKSTNQLSPYVAPTYTPMLVPLDAQAAADSNNCYNPVPDFRPVRATLARQSSPASQLPSFSSVIGQASPNILSQPITGMGTGKGKRLDISKSATEKKVESELQALFSNKKPSGWSYCTHE